MTALELFRTGYDTQDIANLQGVSEAEVYNEMHAGRQHERQLGKNQDYQKRYYIDVLKPKRRALREYCGQDSKGRAEWDR